MQPAKTIALAATLGLAAAANAQSWTGFQFAGEGDVIVVDIFVEDFFPQLQVTDAFLSGDQFSVRVLDGSTIVAEFDCSEPTVVGDTVGGDYDAAFADDRWSSGEACLTARGALTMEITVIASPFGAGGAGWRLAEGTCESCRVDLDEDGSLTIFDFLAFQNLFDAGDLIADFDGDGALTIFDFLAFQNEFDIGCE